MSYRSMPFIFINMSGELIYILEQQLKVLFLVINFISILVNYFVKNY